MENDNIDLEKRDVLLSNERTFLAYTRTSASVIVLAVALFKFFESRTVIALGYVALALGLVIFILGIYRYFEEKKRISEK